MATRTRATLEELSKVEGKAELVDGEIVFMSPTGGIPGIASALIAASLVQYVRQTKTGWGVGDNVGFRVHLPRRETLSPDARSSSGMWIWKARMPSKCTVGPIRIARRSTAEVRSRKLNPPCPGGGWRWTSCSHK